MYHGHKKHCILQNFLIKDRKEGCQIISSISFTVEEHSFVWMTGIQNHWRANRETYINTTRVWNVQIARRLLNEHKSKWGLKARLYLPYQCPLCPWQTQTSRTAEPGPAWGRCPWGKGRTACGRHGAGGGFLSGLCAAASCTEGMTWWRANRGRKGGMKGDPLLSSK